MTEFEDGGFLDEAAKSYRDARHLRLVQESGEAGVRPQRGPPPTGGITAAALQGMEFPPIKYVVEGYLTEGLTIFAGRPKLGKSWLCLDIAGAVAMGGVAFGKIDVEAGDVLYAALEDNLRRLQSRMRRVTPTGDWPDRLTFWTEMKRLDEGGLAAVRAWVEAADNPRLIIIDTLAKVRGSRSEKDTAYESDYKAMTELHKLASEKGLAIVLVHHVRKMEAEDPLDTVSGTLGLTGAADTVLVLNRSGQGTTLYGRGRDIEEIETAVQFERDLCRWTILGEASEVHRSDERTTIVEAMREAGDVMTVSDMVAATGMNRNNLDQLLYKMRRAGAIERIKAGTYRLCDTPDKTDKTIRNAYERARNGDF